MKIKRLLALFSSALVLLLLAQLLWRHETQNVQQLIVKNTFNQQENYSAPAIGRAPATIDQIAEPSAPEEIPPDDKTLLEKSLSVYKEQGQYQFQTLPLDESKTSNPLLRHYRQKTNWSGSPEGNNLRARLVSDKDFYTNEKDVFLTLEYQWQGPKGEVEIEAELYNSNHELLNSLSFNLDLNGQWKAQINIATLPDDIYLAQARIKQGKETVHLVKSLSLQKASPDFITIDKSQISNGDLQFSSLWQIKQEGYYLVEAVLTNEKGKAIAAYEEAIKLPAGKKNVIINFDGYLFFQKKYQGTFSLSQITLSRLGDALEIKRGPLVEPQYHTQSFSWQNFRSTPNPDPSIQEKIKTLESKLSSL